jgi:hypothetical protein
MCAVWLSVGCCFIVAIPIFVSSSVLAWCLAHGVLERCLGALGGIYRLTLISYKDAIERN